MWHIQMNSKRLEQWMSNRGLQSTLDVAGFAMATQCLVQCYSFPKTIFLSIFILDRKKPFHSAAFSKNKPCVFNSSQCGFFHFETYGAIIPFQKRNIKIVLTSISTVDIQA